MSQLEDRFYQLWQTLASDDLPRPHREHRFHPVRKWRFDFAWPLQMVAVEIEGGIYGKGRHNSIRGMINDCDKYNAAAVLGWTVLRFTEKHLTQSPVQVIEQVKEAFA